MTATVALMSAILLLVLLGNYLQAKERTTDRKARAARDARLDAALTELEALINEIRSVSDA